MLCLIGTALMISDLDLFAMVLSMSHWLLEIGGKMEAKLNFVKGTAFRLSGLQLRVNCKAELRIVYYLNGSSEREI
jgi:hypothetical protein